VKAARISRRFARADALAIQPRGTTLEAGAWIEVVLLD
jgi:hypothetical protein